jgi:hypothetical protein
VELSAVMTVGGDPVATENTEIALLPDGTIAERGTYLALEAFTVAPQIRE